MTYNMVNPNVIVKLIETELARLKADVPKYEVAKGIIEMMKPKTATIVLSNLAILSALFASSRSSVVS